MCFANLAVFSLLRHLRHGLLLACLAAPALATEAVEVIPASEADDTRQLIALLQQQMRHDYPRGLMLRDAHPKAHGCVRAEFAVAPDLPAALRVGVFAEPRRYQAWVRFSNASGKVKADEVSDLRGVAIKLLDVGGEPLVNDLQGATNQDFLLLSHPVLPVGNVADFLHLAQAVVGGNPLWFFLNPFDSHLRALKELMSASKVHTNPLQIRYWSTTPYQFGEQAAKYSLRPLPLASVEEAELDQSQPDFLRQAMARQLLQQPARFEFLLQLRTDPASMPIEDASIVWDETAAPMLRLAILTIPPQSFDSKAQRAACEALNFNPWHSLPPHRPLGGINRARNPVYQTLAGFRASTNAEREAAKAQ
jgi:hypothetical protein